MGRNEKPEKSTAKRHTSRGKSAPEKKTMSRLVPDNAGARMASASAVQLESWRHEVMSTLAVVEEILREAAVPMSVREIVERAGARLPSKSKTPDTVVARDLSMDIKKKGDSSLFVRTSPGRYTLRTIAQQPQPMSALGNRKPAAAAAATTGGARAGRPDTAEGGGYAS
jgi:hypothetical protein